MNFTERVLQFDCAGDRLTGIVSVPASVPGDLATGVVIVVGGPQYRAGSHRQFVLLSRALASAGIVALRFDYRGMGDSTGLPHLFDDVEEDIGCAISALLGAVPGLKQVVLWGLCDGASAALMYCAARADQRVAGLCLLNPWVRSTASLAKTHVKHYYTERLRQREFWLKLLSGKVAWGALKGLIQNVRTAFSKQARPASEGMGAPYQTRMANAWRDPGRRILLILSGNDLTAKEFTEYVATDPAWSGLLDRAHVVRQNLPDADHTFSDPSDSRRVERLCIEWMLGA